MEGIFLYMFVVKVYNIEGRMAIYHIFSWGELYAINIHIVFFWLLFFFLSNVNRVFDFVTYLLFAAGLPAIMVSISLTIASAIDGIHSFVGEK